MEGGSSHGGPTKEVLTLEKLPRLVQHEQDLGLNTKAAEGAHGVGRTHVAGVKGELREGFLRNVELKGGAKVSCDKGVEVWRGWRAAAAVVWCRPWRVAGRASTHLVRLRTHFHVLVVLVVQTKAKVVARQAREERHKDGHVVVCVGERAQVQA